MGIPIVAPYVEKPKDSNLGAFIIRYFALTDKDGTFTHTNGDGSECPIYGYVITHDVEPIKMVYITDCSLIKWRFKNVNTLLLGIDYADNFLESETNEVKKYHVLSGHLSLETGIDFIKVTDRDKTLKNVIVGHLSDDNSDYELFENEISRVTAANVSVARRGIIYEL